MRERLRALPDQGFYVVIGLLAVVALYLVGFVVKNARDITIDFVVFSTSIPLIVLMGFLFLLGVGVGVLTTYVLSNRRYRKPGAAPIDITPRR